MLSPDVIAKLERQIEYVRLMKREGDRFKLIETFSFIEYMERIKAASGLASVHLRMCNEIVRCCRDHIPFDHTKVQL